MRYAIDRYAVGTETEVNADDFDGQYHIPERRNRFYCPECGEIVYFRAKGGGNPNQFYHQKKTDRTPGCDKRVDGRSGLSLSQRVGLPIYLTGIVSGRCQLNIGFPALGTEMLSKAISANYTVGISGGNQSRTVKVNFINFMEDEVSLIPVDFVPACGKITKLHSAVNEPFPGSGADGLTMLTALTRAEHSLPLRKPEAGKYGAETAYLHTEIIMR